MKQFYNVQCMSKDQPLALEVGSSYVHLRTNIEQVGEYKGNLTWKYDETRYLLGEYIVLQVERTNKLERRLESLETATQV